MQVLGFVILAIIAILIGIGGMIFSIVGLILSCIFCKTRKRKSLFITLSAVALAIFFVIAALPTSFFLFIIDVNSTPPSDYVETDITVELTPGEYESFTANGKVYRVLPFHGYTKLCQNKAVPVFSYKPEGFMNRSQWYNYYRIETDGDFELIADSGYALYCTDEDRDAILSYYAQAEIKWYMEYYPDIEADEPIICELSAKASEKMLAFSQISEDEYTLDTVVLSNEESVCIIGCSADGVAVLHDYPFTIAENKVYYSFESIYNEDNSRKHTAYLLPDEIAQPILDEFAKIH